MTEALLEVRDLTRRFRTAEGGTLLALDGLSFQVRRGEIFGLVGESGSGKSTAARCVMNLLRPHGGQVLYQGADIWERRPFRHRRRLQAERQMIFQDSASSLNPRMTVAEILAEPMEIHHVRPPRGSLREEAAFQLGCVGLDGSFLDRYPAELSGGQRQRVAIARALTMEPALLVADEPLTGLDVSVQAQILNLFRHLRQEHGFTFLFIAHDLAVVRYLCRRVGVLYQGRLVECAPVESLFTSPRHPYTRALLSAMPLPDPRQARRPALWDAAEFAAPGVLREIAPDHWARLPEECG